MSEGNSVGTSVATPASAAPPVAQFQNPAAIPLVAWGPVRPEERIGLIDALRGLALLGIVIANMRGFAGPLAAYMQTTLVWRTPADFRVQALIDTFVQGKFITLFAFLFGAGFALQFARAEARQARFVPTYRRRAEALILLGGLHQLLFWWGDILVTYGLGGLLLLFFRKRRNKTILIWAMVLLLMPSLGMSGYVLFRQVRPLNLKQVAAASQRNAEREQRARDTVRQDIEVYGRASYGRIFRYRLAELAKENSGQAGAVGMTFPIFLLGLWVFRRGVLQSPENHLRLLRAGVLLGFLLGIPANIAGAWLQQVVDMRNVGANPTPSAVVFILLFTLGRPLLSMGYASAFTLLFLNPRWRQRLLAFAAVGRTALSNYLLQSVVGTTIFYGYGGALFGRVHLLMLFLLAVVMYGVQVPLSRWWLARYRFGPVEWLWRTMTYGQPPPMRVRVSAAAAV